MLSFTGPACIQASQLDCAKHAPTDSIRGSFDSVLEWDMRKCRCVAVHHRSRDKAIQHVLVKIHALPLFGQRGDRLPCSYGRWTVALRNRIVLGGKLMLPPSLDAAPFLDQHIQARWLIVQWMDI